MIIGSILGVLIFLIAAFPLKNYLLIQKNLVKKNKWIAWAHDRPSFDEYCEKNDQSISTFKCDFCGEKRVLPSLEMVIPADMRFGYISNSYEKYLHFKSHFCSKCGTDLYRKIYTE